MISSILPLLKLLFLYFFTFYLIPVFLHRRKSNETWLDRFMMSFIHSHVFIIASIHLLVALHIYETISLLFLSIAVYLFFLRHKMKTGNIFNDFKPLEAMIKATDSRENLGEWKNQIAFFLKELIKNFIRSCVAKIKSHPFTICAAIIILLISAYIRFHHSFTELYFGSADPYVHLKWSKLLGANQMYVDGVYPYGYNSVMSALEVLYNLDPYYIARYLGPLSGVLLVIVIYYSVRKLFPKDYLIAVFAILTYLFSSFEFGFIWRQISSLSMEYGIIFLLPGIHFFY